MAGPIARILDLVDPAARERLMTALKAEAVKLGLIAILLGLVLAVYSAVVVPAFLGSFMATVLIFSMAFFVREHNQHRS